MCEEVQGIGALDFANRGSRTIVQPAFGKGMGETECVSCGQCARVCPTGALAPKNDIEALWKALTDPATTVIAQIAPAVRVAIGERFGLAPGAELTGRMTAAMRRLGFAQVYDTGFTADLTVWEEGAEFVRRLRGEGTMPLLTSCCPAWVRYVEQFHPQFLPNLSSCRSPQQMFGALSRSLLPQRLKVDPAKLVVVSVMPCTAKKMEAAREEFRRDGRPEVDLVITTGELARMIDAAGLRLDRIEPEGMDRPFAARSGAGLLFGASGGVSEAVLRYADAVLGDGKRRDAVWEEVRGDAPLRIAQATFGGRTVRVGVVSGLKNAGAALADIKAGRLQVDLLEVMACPGGCINGAGQPCTEDPGARACRTAAMRTADRIEPMHNSADNEGIKQVYVELLGEPGSHTAHDLLHTHYNHRKRIDDLDLILTTGEDTGRLLVSVCLGTSCHLRGSQAMLKTLLDTVDARGLGAQVDIRATFCLEACGSGPNVRIGDQTINKATPETVLAAIEGALAKKKG
jgi:NADH-quinone oxidoreductase subunit G